MITNAPKARDGTRGETSTAAHPVPIRWGGHRVTAPGFTQDQFERAMARAFVDDLRLQPLGREKFLVHAPGASRGHHTTRDTCTCPAGEHDVPCKHRALVIAHLDIRAPQLARRWAKRLRDRRKQAPAAKAA
ncbi:MAG: SWIM zinc finger family protein [Chloroflexota bacterium]|nr:SWIM zinc finger family protein [Chloroflexota bacterium]